MNARTGSSVLHTLCKGELVEGLEEEGYFLLEKRRLQYVKPKKREITLQPGSLSISEKCTGWSSVSSDTFLEFLISLNGPFPVASLDHATAVYSTQRV